MSARAAVMQRLTWAGGSPSQLSTWMSVRNLSPSPGVPLHKIAYEEVAGLPRSKWWEREKAPRWKLQHLLWPHLRSDIASLLLCSISREDHPWYSLGGNHLSVWILGSRAHWGTSWSLAPTLPLYLLLPLPLPLPFCSFNLNYFLLTRSSPILVLDTLKLYSEAPLLYLLGGKRKMLFLVQL